MKKMTIEQMINAGDWKALLEEAKKLAEEARAELEVAQEKFADKMCKVKELVEQAIEIGGEDAKEKWQEFWKNFEEGLEELAKTVQEAISKFSEKINWVKNRYWLIALAVVAIAAIGWFFYH